MKGQNNFIPYYWRFQSELHNTLGQLKCQLEQIIWIQKPTEPNFKNQDYDSLFDVKVRRFHWRNTLFAMKNLKRLHHLNSHLESKNHKDAMVKCLRKEISVPEALVHH